MTDLTEQWRKGELPEGWYWVKYYDEPDDEIVIDYYEKKVGDWRNYLGIIEVLAPVPSFEEWKAADNCMLENEVLRLKNKQLKELLKECRGLMNTTKDWACTEATETLITKIDGVLK